MKDEAMSATQEKAAPPQTEQDHIERLRAMESDHGETWDLSPNDQAAIRWARHQIETIDEALARRPALAEFKHRYDKVYHACEMAGRAEKAEAVNKELLEALRKYGKHLTACACFEEFDEKACDCGFGKYEAAL